MFRLKNLGFSIWSFLLLFCCGQLLFAQEPQTKPEDSAALYKKIETYSKKRKFTKTLHGLIFEPVTKEKPKRLRKVKPISYRNYQGKIIRKIDIITLDPFGYDLNDTTRKPKKALEKAGNFLHIKSKQLTIWNAMIVRKNQPLDSLRVKESERLIRTQRFVRRVSIKPIPTASKDSVDLEVRVLDSWSLIPDIAISSSKANYKLTERNFLGIGHQFSQQYQRDMTDGDDAYTARYKIPNIMNTFVQSDFLYNENLDGSYLKSIDINRPFYSPFTRWAAGIYIDTWYRTDSLFNAQGERAKQPFKSNTSDIWAGHSIRILKGDSENDRTTNFIVSIRHNKRRFTESPELAYDTVGFYRNERNYLIGLGISSRQYIQETHLFNFGVEEDVPVGRVIGLIGGIHYKNHEKLPYFGARYSQGSYYKYGFWSFNIEYGSFFRQGNSHRSAFVIQSDFFTPLYEVGDWKFRQFIKGRFVLGSRREASYGDMVHLYGEYGVPGLRGNHYFGTKKWVLTGQTQAYSPWNFWGFRLNPFIGYSVGMLGDNSSNFKKSKAYSQIGFGFIVSNDYLVFSSFQLSFSYIPSFPGRNSGALSTNAFSTEDFGLMSYDFSKPEFVNYQ